MSFSEKEPANDAPVIVGELPGGLSPELVAANGELLMNEPVRYGRRVIFIKNTHADSGIFKRSFDDMAAFYVHQKHVAAFLRSLAKESVPHHFQYECLTPELCENPETLRRDAIAAKNLWLLIDQYHPYELLNRISRGLYDQQQHLSLYQQSVAPASVLGDMLFGSAPIHKLLPGHRRDLRVYREAYLTKIKALIPISASLTDIDLERIQIEYLQARDASFLERQKFVRQQAETVPHGGVLIVTYGGDHFRLNERDITAVSRGLEDEFADGFDRTVIEPFGGKELIRRVSPHTANMAKSVEKLRLTFANMRRQAGQI